MHVSPTDMVWAIGFAIALAYAFDLAFEHACALAQAKASYCQGNGWKYLETCIICSLVGLL